MGERLKSTVIRGLGVAALTVNSACFPIDVQIHIGSGRNPTETPTVLLPYHSLPDKEHDSIFPTGMNINTRFLRDEITLNRLIQASNQFPIILVDKPFDEDTEITDLPYGIRQELKIRSITFTKGQDNALGVILDFDEGVRLGSEFQRDTTPVPLFAIAFNPAEQERKILSTRLYGSNTHLLNDKRAPLTEFYADFHNMQMDNRMPDTSIVILMQRALLSFGPNASPDRTTMLPLTFRFINPSKKS